MANEPQPAPPSIPGAPLLESTRSASTGRDLAHWLFKHLWFLTAVAGSVTVLVALFAYLLPPTYRAVQTVLVERSKSPTQRADVLGYPLEMFEVISSEIELVRSRSVAELVVERLQLDRPSIKVGWLRQLGAAVIEWLDRTGLVVDLDPREKAIRGLRNNLDVQQLPGSTLLQITYDAEDPQAAAEITRAITEAYMERHRAIFADNSERFFVQLVTESEKELAQLREKCVRETDGGTLEGLRLELKAGERTFLFLRDKLDQAQATAGADPSLVNVRVVDYPATPTRPVHSRLLLIVLGLLGGIVLAVALALLREYFDHTVRSPDDLDRCLQVPVLGSVRRHRGARRLLEPPSRE